MSSKNRMQHCVCDNPECFRSFIDIPEGEPLVCPDCGEPLRLSDNNSSKKKGSKTAMIIIIVAAAVLLLGGGGFAAWYFFFKDKAADKSERELTEQLESEIVGESEDEPFIDIDEGEEVFTDDDDIPEPEPDFIGEEEEVEEPAANNKTEEKVKEKKAKKETKTSDTAESKKLNTANGYYIGPRQGGKAHGIGQFVFSHSMTIPLNDGYGTVIKVERGDRVYSAKFVDGRLRQGKFVFRNGDEKFVMGINQEL